MLLKLFNKEERAIIINCLRWKIKDIDKYVRMLDKNIEKSKTKSDSQTDRDLRVMLARKKEIVKKLKEKFTIVG